MSLVTVEIIHAKKLTPILNLQINTLSSSVLDVKKAIQAQKSYLYPDRQMLRLEANGKPLKDEDNISNLKSNSDSKTIKLYFKDLGPQVGWSTVLLIYLSVFFYLFNNSIFFFHRYF